ncbi:MAG: hypothetical protein IKW13_01130 [Thermoguttaceae bacterium]|nr:hypothetical protein [Thermoguttaceae bacterium]
MTWIYNGLNADGGLEIKGIAPIVETDEIFLDGITLLAGPNGSGKTVIRNHMEFGDEVSPLCIDFSRTTPLQTLEALRFYPRRPIPMDESKGFYSEPEEIETAREEIAEYVERLAGLRVGYDEYSAGLLASNNVEGNYEYYSLDSLSPGELSLSLLNYIVRVNIIDASSVVYIELPEAFLSPEWIVEYARVLVWVNKRIGTRFFVTSHNPDFVAAIRYISEYEGTLDKTRFYYAKKKDDGFAWKEAKEDGDDPKSIAPLFKIFIKGIEKIAEYSNDKK